MLHFPSFNKSLPCLLALLLLGTPAFAVGNSPGTVLEEGIVLGPSFVSRKNNEQILETKKHDIETVLKEAKEGKPEAQFKLGQQLIVGVSLQQNNELGLHYLLLAADQDQSDALIYLGECYLNGKSVTDKPAPATALEYFKRAKNNDVARLYLANMMLRGIGCPKDPKAALEYLHPFSDGDNAAALYAIAKAYYEQNDFAKASEFYRRVMKGKWEFCDKKIRGKSEYMQAKLSLKGFGEKLAPQEVKEKFETAAEAGVVKAICDLANLYRNGMACVPNIEKARALYKEAKKEGSDQAKGGLFDLAKAGKGIQKPLTRLQDKLKKLCWNAGTSSDFFNRQPDTFFFDPKTIKIVQQYTDELCQLRDYLTFPQSVFVTSVTDPAAAQDYLSKETKLGTLHETKFDGQSYYTVVNKFDIDDPIVDPAIEDKDIDESDFRFVSQKLTSLNLFTERVPFEGDTFKSISAYLCDRALWSYTQSWSFHHPFFELPPLLKTGGKPKTDELPKLTCVAQLPDYLKFIQAKYEDALEILEAKKKEAKKGPKVIVVQIERWAKNTPASDWDKEYNADLRAQYNMMRETENGVLDAYNKGVNKALKTAKKELKAKVKLAKEATALMDKVVNRLHTRLKNAKDRNETFANDPRFEGLRRALPAALKEKDE